MPTSPIQSYGAQVRTVPPRVMTFPAGSDAAAALLTAKRWVEEQARDFLAGHSLPKNPWDAGSIFAGEVESRPVREVARRAGRLHLRGGIRLRVG